MAYVSGLVSGNLWKGAQFFGQTRAGGGIVNGLVATGVLQSLCILSDGLLTESQLAILMQVVDLEESRC
ncbi:hypothetical protein X743_18935 [Mesorhizobium sp. LNHC252B00]|nr:hypothetical protein X743_18935 [Mesorhizobium sp. LNHC252B00]